MVMVPSVLSSIRKWDVMFSVNLKDMYFPISIRLEVRYGMYGVFTLHGTSGHSATGPTA